MAKSPLSLGVQPSVLRWARETLNLSVEEAAARLGRVPEDIVAWEEGKAVPTYAQLEKLAYEVYKRPTALFFLPAPPDEPDPTIEFRSLPEADLRRLPRDTRLLLRRARAYQFSLQELYARSPVRDPIWHRLKLSSSRPIVEQAQKIRSALQVPPINSNEWGGLDGDAALKVWRAAIEAAGVFVFKDSFKQAEISGFCFAHPEFPLIYLNNGTTKTRQIFSLLHELAHILLMRTSISNFDPSHIDSLPISDRRIEIFCNRIASEVLVPSAVFAEYTSGLAYNIEAEGQNIFEDLAKRFFVSREVIARRFFDEDRISEGFYLSMKRSWDAQLKKSKGEGGNFYLTKAAYLSERLMGEVFARYGRRQITDDEAADLMGVKPNQLEPLENLYIASLRPRTN